MKRLLRRIANNLDQLVVVAALLVCAAGLIYGICAGSFAAGRSREAFRRCVEIYPPNDLRPLICGQIYSLAKDDLIKPEEVGEFMGRAGEAGP